ncbi:MAG TPA: phosphoribosylanthranilate isomerase [Pyrinomonadaceae bacterium]|nr:phosphoribosylanthranilate isomerase [Pyrinomonadaceae bacterium]
MTKVKICGITNLEDALLSAKFGADALGFNFYEKSPRYILPENAREIIEQLPEKILKVGVFVNESLEKIIEIAQIAKLDALQLHGEETPEFARELKAKTNLEIIKAFRVSPEFAPEEVLKYETDAILLDAYNPKEHGGTGETFDWEIAKKVQELFPKMYLAGGLSTDNTATALRKVKPRAVDSCSYLEIAKGKKDKVKIINFISNIKYLNQKMFLQDDILNHLGGFRAGEFSYLKKSIREIIIFIFGYFCALNETEFKEKMKFFVAFEKHLGIKRTRFVDGFFCYESFFLEKSNNDDEKAFDLFFALLEEFKLEKEDLSNK